MNAIVAISGGALPATASEVKAHVQRIQQVMKAVMKPNVHYGKIPGAGDKMTLLKPGAEVLGMTFHVAPSYRVEDLSDGDSVRYRVTCVGTHQGSGVVLGEGMGEASSNEEKYKWKACYNKREFQAADDTRKRVKYGYDKSKRQEYEINQVRTEPADVANTILKMANKRAQVAMIINVTAASDIFTQDLEDMPDDLRDSIGGDDEHAPRGKPEADAPKSKGGSGKATEKQVDMIRKKADDAGISAEDICKRYNVDAVSNLAFESVNDCLTWIREQKAAREPGQDG